MNFLTKQNLTSIHEVNRDNFIVLEQKKRKIVIPGFRVVSRCRQQPRSWTCRQFIYILGLLSRVTLSLGCWVELPY